MADNNGKIYITISNQLESKDGGVQNPSDNEAQNPGSKASEKGEKDSLTTTVSYLFFQTVANSAKQAAEYAKSNIGNFTGDYQTQRNINNSLQAISTIGSLVMAGATAGVPGLVIASASMATSFTLQEISADLTYKKQNRQIDMLRELSGMDALTNGGRME